jgi:hypothetical protein
MLLCVNLSSSETSRAFSRSSAATRLSGAAVRDACMRDVFMPPDESTHSAVLVDASSLERTSFSTSYESCLTSATDVRSRRSSIAPAA